ncbi:DNA polymerase ligase N-terminal domain-containing protein [Mycobacterium sp.]|uniref:DNA polymerase ligase N-terminal domain-containing protein n=1 Tax=Mycobacterium sp. TaxID=1785 RepID=UPI003C7108CE
MITGIIQFLDRVGAGTCQGMSLSEYRRKRRSGRSQEQRGRQQRRRGAGRSGKSDPGPRFVIHHHAARSDHYDFRLEIDGVLVSWAIPKGPSTNPEDRRMARRTEDNHPLEYAEFEGVIPDGEHGAGSVIVWDHGTYANRTEHEMTRCLGRGHLAFYLHGEKLHGGYALTRIREGKDETWLLLKRRDEEASDNSAEHNPVRTQPESVLSGRTLDELS